MKAAAVLLGCLVALASTEPSRKAFVEWIISIIQTGTEKPPVTIKPQVPVKNCSHCECGKPLARIRKVDGMETKILEFPWVALIMNDGRLHCGGSVINDLYVLTAAHCVSGRSKNTLSVRLQVQNRTANETKHVIRKVAAIIQHSRYDPSNTDNDIALLKLNKRVDLSKAKRRAKNDLRGVGSVCLPPYGLTFNNLKGIVMGRGATEESEKLEQVTVPILSNAACRRTAYGNLITKNMMCAGKSEGRHDVCQGDSGGPLHVLNSNTKTYRQVGVVSWSEGCARPNHPGVYSRVNRYLSWIKRNTKDACYCS